MHTSESGKHASDNGVGQGTPEFADRYEFYDYPRPEQFDLGSGEAIVSKNQSHVQSQGYVDANERSNEHASCAD